MISLRPAVAADVVALERIVVAAYQPYVSRIGRPPAPMTADYARAVETGSVVVAVDDGVVVGLMVLRPRGDHLLLDNVAVAPAAQRRGIGARLLALADSRARELGVAEVRLYTNESMTENLRYYPSHGYIETHRALQDGYRRVFFRKPVSSERPR